MHKYVNFNTIWVQQSPRRGENAKHSFLQVVKYMGRIHMLGLLNSILICHILKGNVGDCCFVTIINRYLLWLYLSDQTIKHVMIELIVKERHVYNAIVKAQIVNHVVFLLSNNCIQAEEISLHSWTNAGISVGSF